MPRQPQRAAGWSDRTGRSTGWAVAVAYSHGTTISLPNHFFQPPIRLRSAQQRGKRIDERIARGGHRALLSRRPGGDGGRLGRACGNRAPDRQPRVAGWDGPGDRAYWWRSERSGDRAGWRILRL